MAPIVKNLVVDTNAEANAEANESTGLCRLA